MEEEMQSIHDNKTWSLVELPRGHRAIGLKWVYKVKRDENDNIIKYKACLVARGYVQCPDIDFEEVYAPVARLESMRLVLAIAAHYGWGIHHMDVKSVFLNGELQEEVYVQQPLASSTASTSTRCCASTRRSMDSTKHHEHGTASWTLSCWLSGSSAASTNTTCTRAGAEHSA
jgi:hypothetical protein